MKALFLSFFIIKAYCAYSQDSTSTYRLRAVGIDVFKNLPFAVLYRHNQGSKAMNYKENDFYYPRIFELYGQLTTPKPRVLLNVGVGYASIEYVFQERLRQHIAGYYLKLGREFHSEYHHGNTREFWGYNLTLTRTKVTGQFEIDGLYFPNYTTTIPNDTGFGIGGDLNVGMSYLLFKHLEVRFSGRSALVFSNIGSPNAIYLPGSGIRTFNRQLALSGGVTIQLFYLTKRERKLNSSN